MLKQLIKNRWPRTALIIVLLLILLYLAKDKALLPFTKKPGPYPTYNTQNLPVENTQTQPSSAGQSSSGNNSSSQDKPAEDKDSTNPKHTSDTELSEYIEYMEHGAQFIKETYEMKNNVKNKLIEWYHEQSGTFDSYIPE